MISGRMKTIRLIIASILIALACFILGLKPKELLEK